MCSVNDEFMSVVHAMLLRPWLWRSNFDMRAAVS
jgi:hypothetical protein